MVSEKEPPPTKEKTENSHRDNSRTSSVSSVGLEKEYHEDPGNDSKGLDIQLDFGDIQVRSRTKWWKLWYENLPYRHIRL